MLVLAIHGAPAWQAPTTSDQRVKVIQQRLQAGLAKLNKEGKQSFLRWIQETCSRAPRSVRERSKLVAFEASLDLREALFREALSDFEIGRLVGGRRL